MPCKIGITQVMMILHYNVVYMDDRLCNIENMILVPSDITWQMQHVILILRGEPVVYIDRNISEQKNDKNIDTRDT